MSFHLIPIGIIHTPFKTKEDTPIQPWFSRGTRGKVELNREFVDGLSDLEGFSHIYLIYYFHRSEGYSLKVVPYMDDEEKGLFATRAPRRPNQIGLSVVKLISIKENIIEIEDADMLDGTPLLDIKPYVPRFTDPERVNIGWLEGKIKK
jgi:tRNA-Thr(GGU) m(6)t(6)A37 methyltransferase TsaA